jgi:peroxiredoxin
VSNRIWGGLAAIAVFAGLVALFGYSGGDASEPGAAKVDAKSDLPRVEVPAVKLPRAEGGTFSSASLKGRSPLVLDFFATWCGPCREELPQLVDLYKKRHSQGLEVVAITREDKATALQFAKEQKLPFPVLVDDGTVSDRFNADTIPLTVVLDKQGRATRVLNGYSPDHMDEIDSLCDRLVKE